MRKTLNICTLYSFFLGVMPIVAIYYSGIPGLNVADVCLLIFYVFALLKKKAVNEFTSPSGKTFLLVFLGYLLTVCLLFGSVTSTTSITDILVRTIRIVFYIVSIYFLSRRLLNFDVLKKTILRVSYFSLAFILLQYLLYYSFSYVLHGFLNFLPLYTDAYAAMDYSSIYLFSFRPTGPFLEPAHCARYLFLGLCFSFGSKKRGFLSAILLSIAIVLSTSGQSLVYLVIVWACYALHLLISKEQKSKTQLLAIIFLLIPISVFLIANSSLINVTLRRIGLSDGFAMTGAGRARLSTLQFVFESNFVNLIFGHGYGSVPYENAWQSGLTYLLFGSGFIGLLLIICLFLSPLKKSTIVLKLLVLLFFLYLITDDLFNSFNILLYGSIILLKERVYDKNSVYCYGIQLGKRDMCPVNY